MSNKAKWKKAVILDRDGTLVEDHGYVHKTEDFKLLPGVVEGLKKLSKEFAFVIITNQSGIGRGIYTKEDMDRFNKKLIDELKKEKIEIKRIYYCPHTPEEGCRCRKPSTRYIEDAALELGIDLQHSWVIGDHPYDIEMGVKAGCKSIYLLTGHGKKHLPELEKGSIKPDFIANGFLEAATFIAKSKCQGKK
jgi:histidinol-phosphate phosphatase family protein